MTDLITNDLVRLGAAWGALVSGQDVALPAVGTSLRRWAHGLTEADRSDDELPRRHAQQREGDEERQDAVDVPGFALLDIDAGTVASDGLAGRRASDGVAGDVGGGIGGVTHQLSFRG